MSSDQMTINVYDAAFVVSLVSNDVVVKKKSKEISKTSDRIIMMIIIDE
jgi:hypothetical protein